MGKAAVDVLQWLRKEVAEMIEAVKNKKIVEWLRLKLNSFFGIEVKPSQADLLSDWGKVAGRGRRLGQVLKKADITAIRTYLKKQGVDLELFPEKGEYTVDGFFVRKDVPATMPEGAQAQFIYTDKQMKMCLRDGATVYEFLHELTHMKHAKSIGLKEYYKLGGRNTPGELIKEKHVFDNLMTNRQFLTQNEIIHAIDYMNNPSPLYGIQAKFGKPPILVDFDVDKVPEVIKELKINDILNIK